MKTCSAIRPLLLSFLFFFTLSATGQELQPTEEEALMTVTVVSGNEKPKSEQEVRFRSAETGKVYSKKTGEDGTFEMLLPKGSAYEISYDFMGEEQKAKDIELPDQQGMMNFELKVVFRIPQKITLNDVRFNTAEATLRDDSYPALKKLLQTLRETPSMKVEIAGHTDSRGDPDENQELSEARAQVVVDYLVEKGIDKGRLVAKGYGEREPVASNDSREGRQKNRRTEVRILER